MSSSSFRHWLAAAIALLVSANPSWAEPVSSLAVEVRTANAVYGGTDNDVHLVLLVQNGSDPPVQRSWKLDSGIDDFERGNQDTYTLTTDLPADTCNIIGLSIQKSPDDFDGGWKLDWFRVIVNGNQFYRGNVDAWLEDDHREWWGADFTPTACGGGFYFGPSAGTRPPMPNCTVSVGSEVTPVIKPDADCDKIPDDIDPVFDPVDTDGDSMPDRTEDWNGNGVVDPGETDPNAPNNHPTCRTTTTTASPISSRTAIATASSTSARRIPTTPTPTATAGSTGRATCARACSSCRCIAGIRAKTPSSPTTTCS